MELDNKYLYLPKEFWKYHAQCEFLINQIEEFVTDKSYNGLRFKAINLKNEHEIKEGEHFLDFLLRAKRYKEHDEFIRNQIINALLIDICYFLQEALDCSKKMRLTVTFALMRKPFVYDLIVILRLMFEDNFLEKFNTLDPFDVTKVSDNEKKNLICQSLPLLLSKSYTADDIFDFVFNLNNQDSIINISNKALHLSTTRNKNNQTEIQNLNFVFSNPDSIQNQWDYLYRVLPFLLPYYVELLDILIFCILDLPIDKYKLRIEKRVGELNKILCL